MRRFITPVVLVFSIAALTGVANARNGGGGHNGGGYGAGGSGGGGGGGGGGGHNGGGGGPYERILSIPNSVRGSSNDPCQAYWNAGDRQGYNICRSNN
jgi:hypothetical protein